MSRVLVTGGAGFIGAHLVERLVDAGHDVQVLDNLKRGSVEKLGKHLHTGGVQFVEGDIRDAATVAGAVAGCDVIYHLAAQSNVMGALSDAEYSFTTNVLGTFNVLRAAVDAHVPRLVFSSSREVYGEPLYTPVDEEHPIGAKNPYGASKVAGEAYCSSFAHCHDIDVAILRLANVYGPGDSDRVIPLWMRNACAGEALQIYGGSQVLDLVWIDRVVDALVFAGEHGLATATNIGSGEGTSIVELGRRILEASRSSSLLVRKPARGAEVTRFVADITRMRALGLEPDRDPLLHLSDLVREYAPRVAV